MTKIAKYNNRLEWKKAEPKAYSAAFDKGIIDEICEIFGWEKPPKSKKTKPNGYWNKENVLAEAKKYKTPSEWDKFSATSLQTARVNGWYKEATGHMIFKLKPVGYWNIKENGC
jgi:hypothetical protein